jgi:hypothetical protein
MFRICCCALYHQIVSRYLKKSKAIYNHDWEHKIIKQRVKTGVDGALIRNNRMKFIMLISLKDIGNSSGKDVKLYS